MPGVSEEQLVHISAGGVELEGNLAIPPGALGVVAFAHGSGSSRHSPRNRFVAETLRQRKLATLLFDLLTTKEERLDEQTARFRFDIPLLAARLVYAAAWLNSHPETQHLPIGYFGASTGAAAALVAAAAAPHNVRAIVSRGGRPDLAGPELHRVKVPTLLIVGGNDQGVIELNHQALDKLDCEKRMEIIPGATHLFEEPGALAAVAKIAGEWFEQWIPARPPTARLRES
jgi:putative phosphoribosyl transferase